MFVSACAYLCVCVCVSLRFCEHVRLFVRVRECVVHESECAHACVYV